MPAQSETAAADVSGALAKASRRVLSHEERLARASTSILRTTGLAAAKRFESITRASLVAAAGDGGWTPPNENELIDVEAVVAALRGKSDPIRRSAIADYGSTLKRLAPEIDWDVTNPLVGGVLAGAAQHVRGIADTTRLNLMRIIRRSYEEGLSIEDTSKAIRVGMTEASKVRGRLIARTEMAAVSNGGALAATKLLADTGAGPYFKRWMTAPGATYPRHEDYEGLDGQTVALDDAFDVGGVALQFPGDPGGPPEEICNCRCSLAFVESQDEPLPGEPEPPPEMPPGEEGDVPLVPVDGADPAELAGEIAANAVAMEPYITQAIQAVSEPLGGHLQGFEYRFKSEGSIKRKIETDVLRRVPGLPPAAAATGVKDALRYTVIYRPGEYVDKMTKTLDALRATGIEAERVKATWALGSPYAGTNALMRTANGYRFELQFHTPQSYNVKEFVNHDKYEVWRKLADQDSPEGIALYKQMVANADPVRRPAGIEGWSYDGSIHADIGLTPFREGVDDPIGFYDTDKFARFEKDTKDLADYYGVTIDLQEKATGVWKGAEEPSVHLGVHDGEKGVRAFSAALARAYRQDGVAIFTPDNGDGVIARFSPTKTPIPEAEGSSIRELMTNMGAHELDISPEFRPDLFKPSIKLKGGGFTTPRNELPAPRVKTRYDKSTYGLPPRIEDTVEKLGGDQVVEGSERPPQYLYRAISEEDYQQALDRGYLKSDQRMNLADEGTVADFTDPTFYLPGKLASNADGVYGGRVLRINYRDEDGWLLDHDGYAKTKAEIPMSQVDLVSPKIETVRSTKANNVPSIETRIVPAERLAPETTYEAMAKVGLPAGRFLPDGTFEVIGSGPEFVKSLNGLSRDLGVGYDAYLGRFDLLEGESGDYEAAIRDAPSPGAVQAGNARRGAEGLPGAPPLEGRAPGDQVRAALGGRELPSSALDYGWTLSKADEAFPTAVAPAHFNVSELDRLMRNFDGFQQEIRGGNFDLRDVPMRREVDRAIEANPLPEDVIAIGGDPQFSELFNVEEGTLPTVGAETFEPGYGDVYLNTSVARSAAGSGSDSGFIVYHLPKGTPALYVDHFVQGVREGQILLPREQPIRVIGVDAHKLFGKPVVHVELTDYPVTLEKPPSPPPGSLVPPPDVSPPTAPPGQTGSITDAMASRLSVDNLWGEHAAIGQARNAARAELPELHDERLIPLLWEKADVGLTKDSLRFSDLSGDQQVHTFFSDGHNTVQQVAAEAQARGEHRIVISDHAHAMTSEDIRKQHEMIDALNDDYKRRGIDFKIQKGIEANILADGSLDVAPEVLAQFDFVNAAIHGPIEGAGGQLTLFKEANTTRLLRALDNPELDVLVHPHSVAADWDAVAAKAAQKGVALEVNGRDLLRNSRQEAAADMIAAAKRHGAKLVIGSDAHTSADLVDVLYAVRFASTHGVTPQDLAPFARVERLGVDPSTSIPASLDASSEGAHLLGGGMNEVWKIDTEDGREFVVKPKPDPDFLYEQGFDTDHPLRDNIEPGRDLERERAAYVVSRLFNDVGGDEPGYHVNVPTYRIGELSKKSFDGARETEQAGVAEFIPGREGRSVDRWKDVVKPDQLHAAALYDAIIGNTDRHAGNFLFGDHDDLWLIDHGLTFPAGPGEDQFQNINLVNAWDVRRGLEPSISDEDMRFLERFAERLPDIYDDLRKLLSPREIEEMGERVDSLLRTRDYAEAVTNHTEGQEPYGPSAGQPLSG